MRFLYQYRTRDNTRHEGAVSAPNREAAFARLRAQGIRPGRLEEAPGLLNKLLGKGKRWMAIVALALLSAGLLAVVVRRDGAPAPDAAVAAMPRHYIRFASEPDLAALFPDAGERYLARFAVPGKVVDGPPTAPEELAACLSVPMKAEPGDGEAAGQLREIVAGMKDELRLYLKTKMGTCESYMLRLEERQAMEADYRLQTLRRYAAGLIAKADADAILSAMGLEPVD